MMIILRGVTYFKENKTKSATHFKWIAQRENHVINSCYSFQVSSMLHFSIFEIIMVFFLKEGYSTILTKQ